MARSSERTAKYAQKVIDSADIVREAIFRHLSRGSLVVSALERVGLAAKAWTSEPLSFIRGSLG
jgi:hypothetical protein